MLQKNTSTFIPSAAFHPVAFADRMSASTSRYTTFTFCLPLNYKFTLMNYDEQKLKVNDALHRLELEIEGSIAFIEYKLSRDMLFLIHTEVPQVQQVLLCKRHCSTRKTITIR